MAYKTIEQSFWTDPKVNALTPECKLLYLYLITNPHAHHSGLYYIRPETIEAETGLRANNIEIATNSLLNSGLIRQDKPLNMLWIVNMARYQVRQGNSKNIIKGISKHFKTLHKSLLIKEFLEYYTELEIEYEIPSRWYGDTISIPSVTVTVKKNNNKEELKEKKEDINYKEIIDYLNLKSGKNFRLVPSHKKLIDARIAEKFTVDDFKAVIDHQCARWNGDGEWSKYLQPSTLFGASKFDGYLNSPPTLVETGKISGRVAKVMALGEEIMREEAENAK
jgi:uncharacterized phage protein (TIGR02220 family)